MSNLKVFLVQFDIHWNEPEENKIRCESMIKTLKNPDLVVLPETFLTGYDVNKPKMPVTMDSPEVAWVAETAKEYGTALMGSMIIAENDRLYNRMIFSDKHGNTAHYDKRHLFTLSDEATFFTPGKVRTVFDVDGWKVFPQICYDLRFPEFSRNNLNYDIAVYSANWPAERIEHWEIMLRSRAVENQAYILGCNRVGSDANGVMYNGNSLIIGPMGRVFARSQEKEHILEYTLSGDFLQEVRHKMPFLKDINRYQIEY